MCEVLVISLFSWPKISHRVDLIFPLIMFKCWCQPSKSICRVLKGLGDLLYLKVYKLFGQLFQGFRVFHYLGTLYYEFFRGFSSEDMGIGSQLNLSDEDPREPRDQWSNRAKSVADMAIGKACRAQQKLEVAAAATTAVAAEGAMAEIGTSDHQSCSRWRCTFIWTNVSHCLFNTETLRKSFSDSSKHLADTEY